MTRAKLGLIGTGILGAPIAMRLAQEGFDVAVFNRTKEKAERLTSSNISRAEEISALLADRPVILLVLSDASAIRDVLLNSNVAVSGRVFIQVGTIAPEESQELSTEFAERGADYLEAPVLGSVSEAKEGRLIVMAGGSKAQFIQHREIFEALALGTEIVHVGEVGTAAALKLAMNQLIGALTAAFSVSLGYVQSSNVPVDTFMFVVRASALYASTYDKKLQRMLDHNFDNPNFPLKHLLKDMRLTEASAAHNGLATETVNGIIQVLQSASDMGLANADYSAIFQAISKRST